MQSEREKDNPPGVNLGAIMEQPAYTRERGRCCRCTLPDCERPGIKEKKMAAADLIQEPLMSLTVAGSEQAAGLQAKVMPRNERQRRTGHI